MSVTKRIPIERFDNTKLDLWCAEHGTRKAALARKMGCSENSLYFNCSKNKYISASLYNLLCCFCNVPNDYFLLPEKEEPKAAEPENANELTEIKPTLNEILKTLKNIERILFSGRIEFPNTQKQWLNNGDKKGKINNEFDGTICE